MHTIRTAIKGQDHPEVELPTLTLLGTGPEAESRAAQAARIINVASLQGATGIEHRLALEGSCYVDVEHGWWAKHQPGAGKFYVKYADGTAECLTAEQIDLRMVPAGDPEPDPLPSAADLDAVAAEQKAAQQTGAAVPAGGESFFKRAEEEIKHVAGDIAAAAGEAIGEAKFDS